jgi:hypothetical protein
MGNTPVLIATEELSSASSTKKKKINISDI